MTATAILADLITELAGTTGNTGNRIVQALRGTADSDTEPARDTAPARVPGDLIDLADWYLTLPTGKQGDPDTVENPELATFTNEFFTLDDTGEAVVFSARGDGVTTKNSHYPRSELREMNGSQKASWSNTSGTHTLDVCEAITKVPAGKPEVVAAQIHDGGDDVLQIRLEGQKLMVQYDDGKSEQIIDPDYTLGTPYHVRIVAADSKVDVLYNGEKKAELPLNGSGWYFKVGAYVQANGESGDANSVGAVAVYALNVDHGSGSGASATPERRHREAGKRRDGRRPKNRRHAQNRRQEGRRRGRRGLGRGGLRRRGLRREGLRPQGLRRAGLRRWGDLLEWRVRQSHGRRREARRRHQRLLTTNSPMAAHRARDRQP